MAILWCDFETRSRCNLPERGVYNYAMDLSTEVLCMSYAFDDEEVRTWLPGEPFPQAVANHKGQVRAHNAAFERLIFWYVLQVNFDLEQFYCTAAQARANCAPGSLEDVGRFSGASMKKDHRGAQLIRLLSIPQADGTFREDADLTRDLFRQALQDPQGTLQRLVAIAGERGLEVNAEDVQHFLQDEAPNGDGQWLLKARGGL